MDIRTREAIGFEKYTSDERIIEHDWLVEQLNKAGFSVGEVDLVSDGFIQEVAANVEKQVCGILELNEKNGSWEIITYSVESHNAFRAANIEGLIIWAWGVEQEVIATAMLAVDDNLN